MAFIDLSGVSGAKYRFRLWRDGTDHLPIAGNFVVVLEGSAEVAVIGMTNDLSQARSATKAKGEAHVYTRLNVARATREAEHADLLSHYPKARVVGEEG
ncbi:hypothetical protein M9M90_14690 [Phenylobacterium sp. LH3H17]|uniref:hypothetical protein n=1 Tax=Phenylobacterium sp. LH3H17 TaxID=2903901 RepID=UPI0020CA1951|nr:hypothetical protein [Phenylobacterium sp. LH3H17]UTP38457.1 hypothetical protein M9M90_14690 [Phenylobacterium sp. LH3H17]